QKYGLTPLETTKVDPVLAAEYHRKTAREMINLWADQHGGEIIVKDACQFLADAGLFGSANQAAGTLYPTFKRMPDFERVVRGRYRRRSRSNPIDHRDPGPALTVLAQSPRLTDAPAPTRGTADEPALDDYQPIFLPR